MKEQIDFQPLINWIQEQLGVTFPMVITYKEGMRTPTIETPNLQPHSGIFASVVRDVVVQFFNFNYNENENTLWGTIYLTYNAWSRGSNGMQIGSCWWNPNDGWKFETEKGNYEKYQNKFEY